MVKRMLQNLGILGTLAGAVAGSYFLGRSDGARESGSHENCVPVMNFQADKALYDREVAESLDSHTLAVLRLKNALGDRLEDVNGLYELSEEEAKCFADIYERADEIKTELKGSEKEGYDKFNPLEMSVVEITKYGENCPWNLIPDNGEYTETDKMATYAWADKEFHDTLIAPVW